MAISAKASTYEKIEIPHLNPESGLYLGRQMSTNRKEKTYLPLKVGEANHIFILGKTGYGKTSFMKALAEALWEYYHSHGKKVMIIIFERKYDYSKYQRLKTWWKLRKEELGENEAKRRHQFLSTYFEVQEKHPQLKRQLGFPGDFAMSLPNYILLDAYISRKPYPVNIFTWHGLNIRSFPTRRIVFRPTRSVYAIKLDNGPEAEVIEGHIQYKHLTFEMLSQKFDIPKGTAYGRLIRKYWKVYGIHDPKKLMGMIYSQEQIRESTWESIKSIMEEIAADPLYVKDSQKDFTSYLTADRINIIDFSDNSNLDLEEQRLIMYLLWDRLKHIAGKHRMDIWIFFDEIQDLIGTAGEASRHNLAWKAIEELYRKGRSLSINVVAGTQYLYKLPMSLIMGAAHIAVIGALASPKDLDILRVAIMDGDRLRIPIEHGSFEEFMKRRKKKGRGWFSFDREFTVKMYFRPNQSF